LCSFRAWVGGLEGFEEDIYGIGNGVVDEFKLDDGRVLEMFDNARSVGYT